jgi:hypothetical protein
MARFQQQSGDQRALLATCDRHNGTPAAHRQRAEQTEINVHRHGRFTFQQQATLTRTNRWTRSLLGGEP